MQATNLKAGDRVKYIVELGENRESDTYGEAVVDRIDTYDNGLVWLWIGEKGYEQSKPFNPGWITEVIKPLEQITGPVEPCPVAMSHNETFNNLGILQEAERDVFTIRWALVSSQPGSNRSDYEATLKSIICHAREALNNLK